MKANNMTCTDYRTVQDEKLVLWLPGASMEDALGMETDIIRIQTDDGDEVEALCGYGNLVSVTYVAESNTMVVTLTRKADDGTGAALDALGEEKDFNGIKYHTFPENSALKQADLDFYKSIGLGYRADFFKDLAQIVTPEYITELSLCDGYELKKRLLTVRGIGDKVADCVRLFGFYKTDSFPVDVWIEKIYAEDFGGKEKNREKISRYFTDTFKSDSGYFQQYLFHYKRNIEKQLEK